MTKKAQDLVTLQDVILWAVDHDARIYVYWDNQHKWDEEMEERMSCVEKKVIKWVSFAAGASAVVGALGGTLIIKLFSGG